MIDLALAFSFEYTCWVSTVREVVSPFNVCALDFIPNHTVDSIQVESLHLDPDYFQLPPLCRSK